MKQNFGKQHQAGCLGMRMYSVPVGERNGVFSSSDTPMARDGDVERRETSKIEHFPQWFLKSHIVRATGRDILFVQETSVAANFIWGA